jgi:hypothetical protein
VRELDSVEQRTSWNHAPADAQDTTGLLRLAALLAETVVVSSTQVLDGRWMLELGPNGVRNLIGRYDAASWRRALPLEIGGNAPSFSQALVWLLHQPQDGEMLRPFEFSTLDDGDLRARVKDALPKVPWRALETLVDESGDEAEAVARLLQEECDVPEPVATALESHWRRWLVAVQKGDVAFVRREGLADFDRSLNKHTEPPSSMRHPQLPDAGHFALEKIEESPMLPRSEIRDLLEPLQKIDRKEHARLVDWHDRGYNRAIAWQYEADFVALRGVTQPREPWRPHLFGHGRSAHPMVLTYSVPEDVRKALRTMSPDAFDVLGQGARGAIENFWARGTPSARHRLAFELESLLRRDTRSAVLADAGARSLLGITAALAGWSIGHLHSLWFAFAVTLAVALVAALPDARRLYKALFATRGVIDLKGQV